MRTLSLLNKMPIRLTRLRSYWALDQAMHVHLMFQITAWNRRAPFFYRIRHICTGNKEFYATSIDVVFRCAFYIAS
jgi:hypothetical protein